MSRDPELCELARRAQRGDQLAFRRLVDRATPILYRLALRMVGNQADAWDVVQDACVRTWSKLPGLKDPAAVLAWMCQIARHAAIERLRGRARLGTEELSDDLSSAQGSTPEQALANAQMNAGLCAVMSRLKEKHRVVLLLREVNDMSYQEIADALGCSVGTVESRLHRARAAMAKELQRTSRVRDRESSKETLAHGMPSLSTAAFKLAR